METLTEGSMKFVIDGRTYDTATSTAAAIYRGSADRSTYAFDLPDDAWSVRYEHVLYRTAKGAFFVHIHETIKAKSGKPVVEDRANAYTPETAVMWIQGCSAMVVDPTGLPMPDEA